MRRLFAGGDFRIALGYEQSEAMALCRVFFFFQAEDGIRDDLVTGVQTCALPSSMLRHYEVA